MKSSKSPKKDSERGFTLIEIVIAVSILTIVVAVGYSGLTQIIQAKKALDDNRDADLIANSILTRMTREFQLAFASMPLLPDKGATDDKNASRARFKGTEKTLSNQEHGDTVSFIALEGGQYLPDGGTHAGLVEITYRVEPDPDSPAGSNQKFVLVREETPYILPAKKAYQKQMVFPITSDLVSLELYYFDGKKNQWTKSWGENDDNLKLPRRIMYSLKIRTPSGKIVGFSTTVAVRASS